MTFKHSSCLTNIFSCYEQATHNKYIYLTITGKAIACEASLTCAIVACVVAGTCTDGIGAACICAISAWIHVCLIKENTSYMS